jgi:hypothetical protein
MSYIAGIDRRRAFGGNKVRPEAKNKRLLLKEEGGLGLITGATCPLNPVRILIARN